MAPVRFYSAVARQSTSIRMPQQSAAGAGHGHGHGDAPTAKIVNGVSDQGNANTQASLGERELPLHKSAAKPGAPS